MMIAAMLASAVIAPPAVLPRTSGWNVGEARIRAADCGRCVQVDSWASTVRYRDRPNDLPVQTMRRLRSSDVIIQVIRSWQPREPAWALKRHPLQIAREQIHSNFEGNPTRGRVAEWAGVTWRNGSAVTVYIWFGSPHPEASVVARAQQELAATTFRRWSIRS